MRRIVLVGLLIVASGVLALPTSANGYPQSTQPKLLTGSYETTNPIWATIGAETGIMLYDLAGEITEDYAFVPPVEAQILGDLDGDIMSGSYEIALPDAPPQGTALDFDGDATTPPAVQVFAPAIYINLRGDMYIDRGEGPLDLSIEVEPMTFDITGGYVAVWSANANEAFPGGPGPDDAVFTEDDPLLELPAGWSIISLDTVPFTIIRDEVVDIPIIESFGKLNDYTDLSYEEAWEKLFQRTQETYPFTENKAIDWDQIYEQITPMVKAADSDLEFHLVISRFGASIPDTHIGYGSVLIFQNFLIGGVGISRVGVTDSGEVVTLEVVPDSAADEAGIEAGAVLLEIDGTPALQALDETPLLFNSASTPHGRRYFQASILFQGRLDTKVTVRWRNLDGTEETASLIRTPDMLSILNAFTPDLAAEGAISSRMLDSGLGYISVQSFTEDVSIADARFSRELQHLIDAGATGIIIDVRNNGGGLVQLAMSMAGHFFPDYVRLLDFYYADGEGDFAYRGFIEILKSAPYYDGPVAVLVNEMTGSAGELFTYALAHDNRSLVVGHTPTAGFTGEVGDGQYNLPGALSVQIPTGRPVHPATGDILIEGTGVVPDIRVPVTLESLLSPEDEVLLAAERALLDQ